MFEYIFGLMSFLSSCFRRNCKVSKKNLMIQLRIIRRNLKAFEVCYTSQIRLKEDIQRLELKKNSNWKRSQKFSGGHLESTQGYFESTQDGTACKKKN